MTPTTETSDGAYRADQWAVYIYVSTHLCATQAECAKALGLSAMVVNHHVRAIRSTWKGSRP